MTIDLTRAGCILVVKVQGELDLSTSPVFRDKIETELARDENIRHLVLDLKDVSFIDSSGLGAVLGRFKSISQRGGKLVGVEVPLHLEKLFALSGLLKIMIICPTVEDALNTL
ncbi:MAG TPA: anti-sigma factor antagonist [Firmicutes bacterium]|nr:anti-sigma factor antagonist [Bacillota bacterium]